MIRSNITKEFCCDKEKLWNIITDNSVAHEWRSDVSRIDVIDDTHFVEYSKNDFPTYFEITKKEKFKEYRLNIKNANIQGSWTGLFKELPNGNVELSFTEQIEAESFVMRLLAEPYLKVSQNRYMRNLKNALKRKC